MFAFIPIVIPHYYTTLYACTGSLCYVYYFGYFVMLLIFLSFLISFMKK